MAIHRKSTQKGSSMRIRLATAAMLLLTVSVLSLTFSGCRSRARPDAGLEAPDPQSHEVTEPLNGETAASLTVIDLQGNTWTLAKSRGRIIVLFFWATYCKPCEEKFDGLNAIHEAYEGKSVEVWALAEDPDVRMVESWLALRDYSMPVALAGDTENQLFFPEQKLLPIPQAVLVGRDGKIAQRLGPDFTLEEVEATVKQLIGEAD